MATTREGFLARLDGLLHGGSVPVAVVATDLDGFAGLNERHGREAGDRVIAAWRAALVDNLPGDAEVVRLGGDEFGVILPGQSAETALIVLDEIRGHFAAHPAPDTGGATTASVGVAANPPHGTTAEDLWRAAGAALMRAKRAGRDQIALYVEEKMVLKSNYYSRAALDRLTKLAGATGRTEASLLREALDDLVDKHGHRL